MNSRAINSLLCSSVLVFVLAVGCVEPTAKNQNDTASSSSSNTSAGSSGMSPSVGDSTYEALKKQKAYQRVSMGLKYNGANGEQAVLDALKEFNWLDHQQLKVTYDEKESKYYLSFRYLEPKAGPGVPKDPNMPSDPKDVVTKKLAAAGFTIEEFSSRREVEE